MAGEKRIRSAPRDFTEEMLPVDRKGLFFDCIKQRFDLIVKCGLVLLITTLPLLFVRLWGNLAYIALLEESAEENVASDAGAIKLIASLLEIPCFTLIGAGFAAISRILRQLVWGEPIFFFHHLKKGLKQNAKSFIPVFFLYGLLNAINTFGLRLLNDTLVSYLPIAITLLLFVPIGLFMLSQTVFYTVTFGKSFQNGFALYLKTAPYVWIFLLILVAFSFVEWIRLILLQIAVQIILIVILLPVFALAWLLFSCQTFDKYINPENYPDIVEKGLYHPNADNTDNTTK